jgi:hypothetical protein
MPDARQLGTCFPVVHLSCTGCTDECHLSAIDNYHNEIVTALQDAAFTSIPKIPTRSFKPCWNDEVERLKEDCIFGTIYGSVLVAPPEVAYITEFV